MQSKTLIGIAVVGAFFVFGNPAMAAGATLPSIAKMAFSKGTYCLGVTWSSYGCLDGDYNLEFKLPKVWRPFASYSGDLWGRIINLGPSGAQYTNGVMTSDPLQYVSVIAPTGAYSQGALKFYPPIPTRFNPDFTQPTVVKPFGTYAKYGFTLGATNQKLNNAAYIAVALKKVGYSVRMYQVTPTGLKNVGNLAASTASGKGTVVLAFLKLYANGQPGLVTMMSGKPKTVKAWKYSATKDTWVQDTAKATLAKLKVNGDTITLK